MRWLLVTLVVWAILFGLAYVLGSGLRNNTRTTTTTTTRSVPSKSNLAPGTAATSQSLTRPPAPIRLRPIVPMPPAPVLRPAFLPGT